jgi:hypothetical protein
VGTRSTIRQDSSAQGGQGNVRVLRVPHLSTRSAPCEYSGAHGGQGEVDALAFIENFAIEEAVMALLLRL